MMESAVGWLAVFWLIVVDRLTFPEDRYTPKRGILGFLSVLTPNTICFAMQHPPTSTWGLGLVFVVMYVGIMATYYWARMVFFTPAVKTISNPSDPQSPQDVPLLSIEELKEIREASNPEQDNRNDRP